jgi:hypothetical protein
MLQVDGWEYADRNSAPQLDLHDRDVELVGAPLLAPAR